jgi:hypothetical protein
MRCSARLFALSLILPVGAAAQTAAPDVVPGLAVAVAPVANTDTVIFRRSVTRNGQESLNGTRTVIRRVVTAGTGVRLLEVEQRFPAGGGEIVDTALADARTMRATAHRSHQPKKIMRFDFVGDSALGEVTAIGAPGDPPFRTELVRQDVGGPIFDSNVLELVIAGLPLAPSFSADLPFFIYERGGRVVMPLRVVERARVTFPELGARDAWIVSLGVPGAPATLWIDAATHVVLKVRYDIAANATSYTDDRLTKLQS